MQTANVRYVLLALVLLVGGGLYAVLDSPTRDAAPRWPAGDDVYAVERWSIGPPVVDSASSHTALVSRAFRSPLGTTGTLTLVASTAPKLYGAGAEVPLLGGGYAVEAATSDLVGESEGIGSLIAQRGAERWLVMYAYGERRGMLGNGLLAWAMALYDGILGRPSDYYKLYLTTRTDQRDSGVSHEFVELARTVFPRVAAWYAS